MELGARRHPSTPEWLQLAVRPSSSCTWGRGRACVRLSSQSLCARPSSPECGVGAEIHAGDGLVALGRVFAWVEAGQVWCGECLPNSHACGPGLRGAMGRVRPAAGCTPSAGTSLPSSRPSLGCPSLRAPAQALSPCCCPALVTQMPAGLQQSTLWGRDGTRPAHPGSQSQCGGPTHHHSSHGVRGLYEGHSPFEHGTSPSSHQGSLAWLRVDSGVSVYLCPPSGE